MTKGNLFGTLDGAVIKTVIFYQTKNGDHPVSLWLDTLDRIVRAKIMSFIERVALGGAKKNLRFIGQGVIEIKIDYGPGYRVYFGERNQDMIILLVGGDKSTQDRDILLAQKYWRSIYVSK